MTKDEEIREAREWLNKYINDHKGYLFDSKALVAYHHHRLEERQNFTMTNFTFKTNDMMTDCEDNLIDIASEPPKEST